MIHRKVMAAFEEIDAAVFNSDTFRNEQDERVLRRYMGAWTRWLDARAEAWADQVSFPARESK